jgi:hypothetical protein
MPILKIQPSAIDSTANYVFGGIISNGVDLDAAVAAAYSQANTSAGGDSFARQTANAAFEAANTKLSTSGGTITGNLIVNAFTANTITANGVNLGTAVAEAFVLANNANKSTTSDTAPANPKVGDSWFDTVTNVLLRYTNDGVSNNWIDITGPQNAGFIYQSYSITPNTSTINETTGNTVIYTVATTNTADNTVLYWTNSGTTTANDFSDSVSNGSVTIINNSATITRSLVADVTTETTETIILNLRTGSNTGPVVAVSPTVTVGDTSLNPASYFVEILSIAGGGGGGYYGGGGGAGGLLLTSANLIVNGTHTITIGGGGAAEVTGSNTLITGTLLGTLIAIAGGRGGASVASNQGPGANGGSGGGGSSATNSYGLGISGQGNNGGTGLEFVGSEWYGGGGGGSGSVGQNASYASGGAGGNGTNLSTWAAATSSGVDGYYAGGGGGGVNNGNGGAGGLGGGGTGGRLVGEMTVGTLNTGGGGGGGPGGRAGGSGFFVCRYLTASVNSEGAPINPSVTGGTKLTSGSYTYIYFTSSGSITG